MGYVGTGMGDRFGERLVSLMALRLALVDQNPFRPCFPEFGQTVGSPPINNDSIYVRFGGIQYKKTWRKSSKSGILMRLQGSHG